MITTNFNGLLMPKLGFGCMRLPTVNNKDDIDYSKAKQIIDYSINHGINYFDTAYFYHNYGSERFLANALYEYKRESYILTDKIPINYLNNPASIHPLVINQLKNCNTSYFDFYFFHGVKSYEDIQKVKNNKIIEYFINQKKNGIFRNIGFSFHGTKDMLKEMLNLYDWDIVQIQLNYFDWKYKKADELYYLLEENNIPCITMESLHGGMLCDFGEKINNIFYSVNRYSSIASWGIRFLANLPNVITILSGMNNISQIIDNVNTLSSDTKFNEKELKALKLILDTYENTVINPCTKCNYCKDVCPRKINIPEVLDIYFDYIIKDLPIPLEITIPDNVKLCERCLKCTNVCPQKIKSYDYMENIRNKEV